MKTIILSSVTLLFANFCSAQKQTVLFVMSAEDTLQLNDGSKLRQTGVFLNEFYLAYKAVKDAGHPIGFATPKGKKVTIDNESKNDQYWKDKLDIKSEALDFIETNSKFKNPISLEKAIETKEKYCGIIIPGGQGLMVDLIYDKNIPILLKHFAEERKPTGLICHAPILITIIAKAENPFIGFKVNAVSPLEEFVIEKFIMKGRPQNRKIAKKLKKLGLNYKSGLPKSNYAVKDRFLITSQNPYSGDAFAPLYLQALSEYEQVTENE